MFFPVVPSNEARVLLTNDLTVGLLIIGKEYFDRDKVYAAMMTNPVMTFIGKISFSLYMWHQLIFAFARYAFVEEITPAWATALSALTVLLSIVTYYGIENTFRDRERMSTRTVLIFVGTLFVFSTGAAFYVYMIGGVVRDYPSLALYRDEMPSELNFFNASDNIHIRYNERVRDLNKEFSDDDSKIRTLVVGNSFGRDAANLLMESDLSDQLEVRYADYGETRDDPEMRERVLQADRILIAAQTEMSRDFLDEIEATQGIDLDRGKIWMLGTKDFGFSNGIHYNRIGGDTDFLSYRTHVKGDVLSINDYLRDEWGDRYIDLIELLTDGEGEVLVFTPDGRFISQDTVHLTKAGARYIADRLQDRFNEIFAGAKS